MNAAPTIACPNCGTQIDTEDLLSHQIEERLKKEFEEKMQQQQQALARRQAQLADQEKALEEARNSEKERLARVLADAKREQEQNLRQQLALENAEAMRSLQEELARKQAQVSELNQAKIQIAQLEREKQNAKEEAMLEAQLSLNKTLAEERERLKRQAQEESQMTIVELKKQLDDQRKLTEEMKRKQEQGSMQLQGEAQELAIEEYLKSTFPFDEIIEIKKGQRGGDCMQRVHTRDLSNCGTIYYESKRAKAWSNDWIDKLKHDMQSHQGDIAVLVTQAMPADMPSMGLREGVWVCSFEEFKPLSYALRESLVRVKQLVKVQENKGGKMELLYNYLVGPQFRSSLEDMIGAYVAMKSSLDKEKTAYQKIWAEREKQILRVEHNLANIYGSLKGLSGDALPSQPQLELGE